MALVESIDIPLGSSMPPFSLPDAEGTVHHSWDSFGERGLLVVFTCNHCPYARAQWPRLVRLAQKARRLGINTVAINPNIHPDYPQDAPEGMRALTAELGIDFPYLIDGMQQTARAFGAQCTPDPYLFNREAELVYHGRVDDNWRDEGAVTRQELWEAIEALAAGEPLEMEQNPAMGCSIKWRKS